MTYYFARTIEAAFPDAVARAKSALSAQGFGVLSEIDVAATELNGVIRRTKSEA